jgi:acyl carrier protein
MAGAPEFRQAISDAMSSPEDPTVTAPSTDAALGPALSLRLKSFLVEELGLDGRDPSSIDPAAPLFGEGLALDSLDALQLAMAVEEKLAVRIPEGPEGRVAFASIDALAAYLLANGDVALLETFARTPPQLDA